MARKKFKDTSANRKKRWNKKSPMARNGKQNGAWKGGKSAHYYRRKANAGKNEVVHHKSGGKGGKGKPGVHTAKTARRSNLKKMTAAQHNKMHPEKGRKAAAARKRKGTKRKAPAKRKTTRKKTTRRKK
jgi:2,4-dienoyl-CoA reductase-like NADH-dependent reductase (Old Yellow Enzyme family)